jgi:hypothetical protein
MLLFKHSSFLHGVASHLVVGFVSVTVDFEGLNRKYGSCFTLTLSALQALPYHCPSSQPSPRQLAQTEAS